MLNICFFPISLRMNILNSWQYNKSLYKLIVFPRGKEFTGKFHFIERQLILIPLSNPVFIPGLLLQASNLFTAGRTLSEFFFGIHFQNFL